MMLNIYNNKMLRMNTYLLTLTVSSKFAVFICVEIFEDTVYLNLILDTFTLISDVYVSEIMYC